MKNLKKLCAFIAAFVLMMGWSVPAMASVEDTGFSDLAADAWYAEAAVWCRENGIMNGTSGAAFSPNTTMNRAMRAAVLYRAAGSPAVAGSADFSDVAADAYYNSAANWASANGIISGYGNRRFGGGRTQEGGVFMTSKIYPPPRNRTVDLIKTLAIFGVLLIHTSAGGVSGLEAGSAPWLSNLFWNALARPAVPLFLMASGALLLPPERKLTLKKLYTHNMARLLAALLFWAACYKLVFLALMDSLTPWDLEAAAKNLLLFRHEEHLYYLHIMLLVYAFLPITRILAGCGDRRLLEYSLTLWLLLGILYPTVRTLWPFTLLGGIPVQWRMNMTYASIGYTLLGYYLTSVYPRPRRSLCLLALLAGFLLTFGGTWAASMAAGRPEEHFLEGMGASVFLEALGIWGLCQSASLSERAGRVAAKVSRASFCVFLTHVFFLQLFARHGLRAAAGPALLTVPLVSTLLLLCGGGTWALLSRVPGVRRWLI